MAEIDIKILDAAWDLARKKYRLKTKKAFIAMVGCGPTTLNNIWHTGRSISPDIRKKLANALGISETELMALGKELPAPAPIPQNTDKPPFDIDSILYETK